MRIAHLSDLHLGRSGDAVEDGLTRLLLGLDRAEFDHLVITGDLTEHGRTGEFHRFFRLLEPYWQAGAATAIPGNHDVRGLWALTDRRAEVGLRRRESLEDSLRESDPALLTPDPDPPRQAGDGLPPALWEEVLSPTFGSTTNRAAHWGALGLVAMLAGLVLPGRKITALRTLLVGGLLGAGTGARTAVPSMVRAGRRYQRLSRRPLFPFLKRIGPEEGGAYLIGLDTNGFASHGGITGARGRVGSRQLTRLSRLLAELPRDRPRIALCHHHIRPCPHSPLVKERLLAMRDSEKLEDTLVQGGVRLVLHGHHHAGWQEDRRGLISIGAPSSTLGDVASRRSGRPERYFEVIRVDGEDVDVETVVVG